MEQGEVMPSRQDAINAAIEAAELQKDLVKDIRKELFPALAIVREMAGLIKDRGIRIKVVKYWPLSLYVTIK